ncbi:keratin, type I cytoskeletal 42-like [Pyxicephalus adspersus]|uniref:keratin, type I cytoskeletal 42-like n=1 Tax=Pyxicephalus adspersus TaxID=30357 RepID=UPI003B5CD849
MRNLNERLLSYLKEVYSLEQDNERLEHKIAKWYENNAPGKPADYSQHFETILDLQNQISTAFKNNVRIIRNIDNSKFNVNDYNNKYEMELSMRRSIDADVTRQRGILEGYNDQIVMLESEVDKLQGEMLKIRRDSEQGINSLTSQLGTRVSVEVEASPSSDLKKALSGIRDEYEKLMEESLRDLENIFRQRSKKLNHQLAFGSERLQSAHTEPIDVKHSLLMMEIELQSEQNMISTLEDTLVEKQAYYVSEFAQLQDMIQSTENQLDKIRTELEIQNGEYERLLDNKTYLEQEIAIYQCLLDENGLQVPESLPTSNQIEQNSNEDMKDEVNTED